MSTCLAAILDGSPFSTLLHLMGRMHPAVVHFPIALLALAAGLETWQLLRRKPELASATPLCLIVGASSAVVASLFGWLFDTFDGGGGSQVDLHKWVGIASTAAALAAAGLLFRAVQSHQARLALRMFLLGSAGLLGATGYLGGELVFGQNHLFKGLFEKEQLASVMPGDAALHAMSHESQEAISLPTMVDFHTEVAPMLSAYCIQCHGEGKVKGKLNLQNRTSAMKGGRSGTSISPGQPEKSLLYTLLVDEDPFSRMPPSKEKQPSRREIETIRKWIEQGADWPDSVALE